MKEDRNKHVDLLGGEEVAPIIKSLSDEDESPSGLGQSSGMTSLMLP